MLPDRHGAISWKRWIFCSTDHLDFENLQNRRRYHNPGKPRTAGLCGREVVASDHLPLSSTFFGRPKSPDLPPKPPLWYHFPGCFSSGDTLAKPPRKPLPAQAAHGPQHSKGHGYHPLRQSLTQPLQGLNVAVFTALYFAGLERPPQNAEAVFLALTAPYLMPSLRQTLFRVRRYTP